MYPEYLGYVIVCAPLTTLVNCIGLPESSVDSWIKLLT